MRRTINLLMALVMLIAIGCGPPDISYIPSPPPATVINCIGWNDHPWNTYLSVSTGILELGTSDIADNATVKLYEDDVLAEILLHDKTDYSRYYGVTSTPKPGKKYKITAERPNFPTAEAEYVHPDSVVIESASVRVVGPSVEYSGFTDVEIRIGFTDPPGEDFYEFDIIHVTDSIFYTYPGTTDSLVYYLQNEDLLPFFVDPAYEENNESFATAVPFSDSYFDGKSVTLDFTAQINEATQRKKTYVVYLHHLSKEYYNYIKTANLQSITRGDPFAQPVLLENNIVNGYGIFGGLTQTKKIVKAQN